MRIECLYQEAIVPNKLEEMTDGIQFLDGLVPFYAKQIDKQIKGIEKEYGIKEDEIRMTIKPIKEGVPIRFKRRDKVIVYGQEYRVLLAIEEIPRKFRLRASRSVAMYWRYVEQTLVLGA